MDLRSFVYGAIFGMTAWTGTLIVTSMIAGVKWQPVAASWF